LCARHRSQPTLRAVKPKEFIIRDVNCRSSEHEIDRPRLAPERAGHCVLTSALVYSGRKEGEETCEEGRWEVAPCGSRIGKHGLVDGWGRYRVGDVGAGDSDTEGCHVYPVSDIVRIAERGCSNTHRG
jgi:hypothetical protein